MKHMKRLTGLIAVALVFSITACASPAGPARPLAAAVPETPPEAPPTAGAPTFADIPDGADYAAAVAWCVESGLMNGVGNGRFDPAGTLDRRTLATVLYRDAGEPAPGAANRFSDVPDGQWYTGAVIWADQQGLLTGYGGGVFGPTDPVTKVQMDVIFGRYQGENPVWPGDPTKTSATRAEVAAALYENLRGETAQDSTPVISEMTELEPGLSAATFSGDDGFSDFLSQGGADADKKVAGFLSERLNAALSMTGNPFGCSAFVAKTPDGGAVFGRNFDWYNCEALVLTARPANAYASISTVNLDFLQMAAGKLEGNAQVYAALYAPLDGMNEKGLAVSVNMIQDSGAFDQDNGKPDLTTTTAVRLLLNQAATVDEAVELLGQYDLHASFGMTVHFAIADNTGRCVAVEYVGNEMVVTESPVVTNFYLAEGPKHGIGTRQSHTRYQTLMDALAENPTMSMDAVRDALKSVGKQNFHDGETTEWSAVFNLQSGEAQYCHRENYETHYDFSLHEDER